ncbi:MAG: ATP-binding protein [Defluviitaleaceae bacterium]|nr:ATP-binding protein [Defluviitaleaceae bacterium]MCL2263456.1 ATP-binding protein [Defluviitaleaceae bacterium]
MPISALFHGNYEWRIFIAVLFFAACVTYLCIFILTTVFDTRTRTRHDYMVACVLLISFSFFYGMMTISQNEILTWLYWALGFISSCLFFPRWLVFLTNILKFKTDEIRQLLNVLSVAVFVLALISVFSGDVVIERTYFGNQFSYQGSFWFTVTFLFVSLSIAGVVAAIFLWMRRSNLKGYREQLRRLVIIVVAISPFVFVADFIIPIFTPHTTVPVAAMVILLPAIQVYISMKKYHTFGITPSNISGYIFESVSIPIFVLNHRNVVTLENDAAVNFMGESIIDNEFSYYMSNATADDFLSDSFVGKTVKVKTSRGERVCDMVLTAEYDKFRDAICKIVVLRDITEEVERDAKLEEQVVERTRDLAITTTTLTTLFDSIPYLIYTKGTSLRFTYCNKAMLDYYDKEPEEVLGKGYEDGLGYSAEDARQHEELEQLVLQSGVNHATEEHLPGPNASIIFSTNTIPLIHGGDSVGIVGVAYDISEMRESEWQMALRYEYSNKLSDALAKITKSPNISSEDVNSAADIISKKGCDALNVHRLSIYRMPEDGEMLINITSYDRVTRNHSKLGDFCLTDRPLYANSIDSERLIIAGNKREVIRLCGEDYNHNMCAMLDAPIRIAGKSIGMICAEIDASEEYPQGREWIPEEMSFISSLADLMAISIAGDERRIAREAAEVANRAKSTFLANMSHEIRTPMNTILGVTDILMQDKHISGNIESQLNKIYTAGDMLLGIINDILDFSKIEAGKMDIVLGVYKVSHLINDSVQLNMMRINDSPIEFVLNVDETLPSQLLGDELRIKQILTNLLSNAFKYTDEGTVTLEVSHEPSEDSDNAILVITVRDMGRGMTKEQLETLFDEYSRFDQEIDRSIEGTGLGSAIMNRLVEIMGGNISVESEPNVGSTFVVRLPQRISDPLPMGRETAENLQQFKATRTPRAKRGAILRNPMPYGKVLVVDDVEANLYVAEGLMKPYQLQITTLNSGMKALEKLKTDTFDIVFMDHMMPGMDGVKTVELLRETGYENPVIALTANAVVGQREVFLQSGFDDFITKPIDIRQLDYLLTKYIHDKHPDRPTLSATAAHLPSGKNLFAGKKIDGLDIAKGIERFHGDEETYLNILRAYTASLRSSLLEIETFTPQKDLTAYKIQVHGIKGASYDIFADKIAGVAEKLEDAADERNIDYIENFNPSFVIIAWELEKKLEELLSSFKDESAKPTADKIAPELLKKLSDACMEYNMDEVDQTMSQIEEFNYESDTELTEWLRENVDMIKYAEIVEKLEKESRT